MNDLPGLYSLEYDEKLHFGTLTWRKQVSSQELRAISYYLIDFVEKHKITKMIYSVYYSHIISPDDRQWIINEISPKLRQAGLRYSAIVLPQNPETQRVVREVVQQAAPGETKAQYFPTVVRAKNWLIHL